MLLECAYMVHQCNKGHWPTWMKLNFPMFRPSVPLSSRNIPTGLRRTHILQRAAGKLFYQWGEVSITLNNKKKTWWCFISLIKYYKKAIGAKLEQLMSEDKQNMDSVVNVMSDENKQRDAVVEDEEEDFLDDGVYTISFWQNLSNKKTTKKNFFSSFFHQRVSTVTVPRVPWPWGWWRVFCCSR